MDQVLGICFDEKNITIANSKLIAINYNLTETIFTQNFHIRFDRLSDRFLTEF